MEYKLFKGLITHVIDPSNFWMRIRTESNMNLFCEYQQRLNGFYNNDGWGCKYECNIDQLYPGYSIVVAQSPETDDLGILESEEYHWERAQVTRVNVSNNTADVFFVDLGYTAIVNLGICRDILPELFNYFAPQVSRVSLTGIKPLARSWTARASGFLERQVNKDVVTLLVHYDDASGCYGVVIYTDQGNGKWQSLIHQMQHNELALGTGDNIDEFLTEDIVNECLQRMNEHHDRNQLNGSPESNTDCQNETATGVDTEVENWHDDDEDFGAIGGFENVADGEHLDSENKGGVTGFDYRTLMQTRSVSISKMQHEKEREMQQQMRHRLERERQRQDSEQSHQDEQDWDAVQDIDFDSEIVSQIYHGVVDQHHNDDGLRELIEESRKLDSGPKFKSPAEERDKNQSHYTMGKEVIETETQAAASHGLSEVESYQLEKQIKEILTNPDMESDFVCASVYSVVEPDVDAQEDCLQAVICAILEDLIRNSSQCLEVTFAILETYSVAHAFGSAMIHVIQELKKRFVRKPQAIQTNCTHKRFAEVVSLLFKHAEDWNPSLCKVVQEHLISTLERWIIFNKQRHLSGEDLINSEFMYLESAEIFLFQCCSLLKSKYEPKFTAIMTEIRSKLLRDGTESWIRAFLLDMLLVLNGDLNRPHVITSSVATQTEHVLESADNITCRDSHYHHEDQVRVISDKVASNVSSASNELPQDQNPVPLNRPPVSSEVLDDSDVLALRKRKEIPKSIRTMPPRFIKKYLLEETLHDVPVPLNTNFTSNNQPSHPNLEQQKSENSDNMPIGLVSSTLSRSSTGSPVQRTTPIRNFSRVNECLEKGLPSYEVNNYIESESASFEKMPPSLDSNQTTQIDNLVQNEDIPQGEIKSSAYNNVSGHAMTLETLNHVSLNNTPVDMKNLNIDVVESSSGSTLTGMSPQKAKAEANAVGESDSFDYEESTKDEDSQNEETEDKDTNEIGHECYFIRYTPQELMDMNPFRNQPKLELWDLWEPKEVLKKMIVMVHPGRSNDSGEKGSNYRLCSSDSAKSASKSPADLVRGSESPKDIECVKGKNVCGSSVDPDPIPSRSELKSHDNCEESSISSGTGKSDSSLLFNDIFSKGKQHSGGFKDMAMDLFKTTDSATGSTGEDNSNDGEVWHDDSHESRGEFLKPKRNSDVTEGGSRKTKKKKSKGKPLDEFLQEQAALKEMDQIDDDDDQLFSAEALQMYEELEQQGIGSAIEMEGARVLVPSKIGSHISSSSKRPSLFSSVRTQEVVQEPARPWCPGRRFCSSCGSRDHVVYDCPEQTSRLLS